MSVLKRSLWLLFFIEFNKPFMSVSALKCHQSDRYMCGMPPSVECNIKDFIKEGQDGRRKRRSVEDIQDEYNKDVISFLEGNGIPVQSGFSDSNGDDSGAGAARGRYIEEDDNAAKTRNDRFVERPDKDIGQVQGNGNNKSDQFACVKFSWSGQFHFRSCVPLNIPKNMEYQDSCHHFKRPQYARLNYGGRNPIHYYFSSSYCMCYTDNCNTGTYSKKPNPWIILLTLGQIGFLSVIHFSLL